MKRQQILEEYIEFKKITVKSRGKIEDLNRYVGKFLNSFKQEVSKCEEKDLVNHLNSLQEGFKVSSINDIKAYLKNFIKWYFKDYPGRFRHLDQLCRTEKPPRTYEPEDMLSVKEVEQLIKGEDDLMWKVYWLVFFYGGFRPSEAIALTWKQISFEDKGVIIKSFSKKNKQTFYKSLPENAEHYLKEWKQYNHSEWVFPSPQKRKDHIMPKSVYFRLIKLSKKVLNKSVTPYTLRHSIATIKYNDDNIKDDDVANQMGHSKNMKETYLNLNEDQLKTRARNIYVIPKKLPLKQKHEFEKKIEGLETKQVLMSEEVELLKKQMYELSKNLLKP